MATPNVPGTFVLYTSDVPGVKDNVPGDTTDDPGDMNLKNELSLGDVERAGGARFGINPWSKMGMRKSATS